MTLAADWTVRGSKAGGVRFIAPFQIGPKAHKISYKIETGTFARGKAHEG